MPRAAASGGPKKGRPGPKAHKLPERFPCGIVLQDICKKQWHLGNVIGQGGFGLIYLASEDIAKPVDEKTAGYVIKIEPKDNGPLYCEMHFYQRVAKASSIQSFISTHGLKYLGIPPFIGTGRIEYNSQEYRFLVMPRFGKDLFQVFKESGRMFAPHTTFAIGLRMVDALQFLHESDYVHADIKASNILLGYAKGKLVTNEVYLVDYGLAYRYMVEGEHKAYREDPKQAHNGTIEFTSRDAHKGLSPSRRGDFEILGYCMLQWLAGRLPWEDNLNDPVYVAQSKEKYMKHVPSLIAACLPKACSYSDCITQYLEAVKKLAYDTTPDYERFRNILRSGMAKAGQKDEWKLDFGEKAKANKRKSSEPEPLLESPAAKKRKSTAKPAKSPAKHAKPKPASAKGFKHPQKASKAKAAAVSPRVSKASPAAGASKDQLAVRRRSPRINAGSTNSSAAKPAPPRTPMTNGGDSARAKVTKNPLHKAKGTSAAVKVTPLTPAGSAHHNRGIRYRGRGVAAVQSSDVDSQTTPGLKKNT